MALQSHFTHRRAGKIITLKSRVCASKEQLISLSSINRRLEDSGLEHETGVDLTRV